MVGHCDRNSQFVLGWGVFTLVCLYLLVEGWPVDALALVDVRGAGFVSQLVGLGDGCQRLLNSLSADSIFSACSSTSYPMGIGLHNGKLFGLGEVGEEGVGDAKELDEVAPVVPELVPSLGSRSHDPMGCRCCCSSAKTREQIFVLRWCIRQEAFWERGKVALNLAKNCESDRL